MFFLGRDKTHDKNFLKKIQLNIYCMLVFNKAYNYYQQFAKCIVDEMNKLYVFLSNNTTISAKEIALRYKRRRGIELLFKKMKQNFQLHNFYGENENAIRMQIWCSLIAQLLLSILQQKAKVKKHFQLLQQWLGCIW